MLGICRRCSQGPLHSFLPWSSTLDLKVTKLTLLPLRFTAAEVIHVTPLGDTEIGRLSGLDLWFEPDPALLREGIR